MNQFLEELAEQRRKFLDGLDANKGDINLDIFEDFYPDQAHFVFELLQNAEDAGATQAKFRLKKHGCLFEHNGTRTFTESDVRSITGIHNSTKSKVSDQIGKFGVGFKSVFVYTLTPTITSGSFAFQISRLVMPKPIKHAPDIGDWTRFWLPFDNPKKSIKDAIKEIEGGLKSLDETTLLFLSNIESISWNLLDQTQGEVLRIAHSENHVEILKHVGDKTVLSSHYLRFQRFAEGLSQQQIAIAFELDFLPKVEKFQSSKLLCEQFKIVPATPGRVAVFFPAEKEFSGFRFHIHAPFVPELSRASIKETPANIPLFQQLAQLATESLHKIRDLNLLTWEFLGVLPNSTEIISSRYDIIRQSIIHAMNEESITPIYGNKGYAPAKCLLQARASLKNLLSASDLEFLFDSKKPYANWVISVQKSTDADRFLASLNIQNWDVGAFIEALKDAMYYRNTAHAWMRRKSDEWHQQFYAMLHEHFESSYTISLYKNLPLARLENGNYSIGFECYFPPEKNNNQDILLPIVAKSIYTSGKNTKEQSNSKKLLESLGVREIGESEHIEILLNQRYREEEFNPDIKDIKRFIDFLEKNPDQSNIFGRHYIFKREDEKWGKPNHIYLDTPYLDTGLTAYYSAIEEKEKPLPLSPEYQKIGLSLSKIGKFAQSVGGVAALQIKQTRCYDNPKRSYLYSVAGERHTSPIDRDFIIPALESVFMQPTLAMSRLLWRTMCNLPRYPNYLTACYRKSKSCGSHYSESQLVHQLRKIAWIPQRAGQFVTPAKAIREQLPEGFPFDSGWDWIKAIEFGIDAAKQKEDQRKKREIAKELGFKDEDELNDAAWFAKLSPNERKHFKSEYENRLFTQPDLSDEGPTNPDRRINRVKEEAREAPERQTEVRSRSVSIEREGVKKNTDPYLRQHYTQSSEIMICQICKSALPFKLENDIYYFEAVELLKLQRRYYQNYLALCPNHAAMFKHANGSLDELKEKLLSADGNEIKIKLAGKTQTIYFTKKHLIDLTAIIEADLGEQEDST